ncbi:GNAT family N-acetyltransferase [Bacillus sp. SCS-153A]|uniref:GNAT family N-acetyltransferase n=1 Tax=Rossellomorea sedimentorum TaxID=3115294 RepID=UPI00390619F9
MNISIRAAKKEELPVIRAQRVQAYEGHIPSIPTEHWEALKQAISSEADQQPGVDLLVAEIGGTIVGSAALFPARTDAYDGIVKELDYPEIRMLAVAAEYRGKGVASALLKECVTRAKSQGFEFIGLHTGDFMNDAISLYEKFGFKRIPQYDFEPENDGIIVKAFRLAT